MRYCVLCVGKVKEKYIQNEIEEIIDRVNKTGNCVDLLEFPDAKIPEHLKEDKVEAFLERECAPMLSKLSKQDYVIALCIEGKEMTTKKHREYVEKAIESGKDRIVYVIGGSLGLSNVIKNRADLMLSFSKMTFPHQLMRMVLLEELERIA